MADDAVLKASTPTVNLGNRTFAVVRQSWTDPKGKVRPQAYLNEVTPIAEGTTVTGWKPTFKGARLPLPVDGIGNPEKALRDFCAAWVKVLQPAGQKAQAQDSKLEA